MQNEYYLVPATGNLLQKHVREINWVYASQYIWEEISPLRRKFLGYQADCRGYSIRVTDSHAHYKLQFPWMLSRDLKLLVGLSFYFGSFNHSDDDFMAHISKAVSLTHSLIVK